MSQLNISIDDVSPHPLSSIDVVDRCFEILDVKPDVKFTLFVPTAYWRTVHIPGRIDTRTERPLYLHEDEDFCKKLDALPSSNFEICYHGRYHGIPNVSNNDEMRSLSYNGFIELWNAMKQDVNIANLSNKFIDIIRPPAMYMSSEAIEAASDLGIKCLALSPRQIHKSSYNGAENKTHCHVVYANAWLPDDNPANVAKTENSVCILYHACTWDRGYLDDDMVADLISLIHKYDFDFSFIEDIE